MYVCVRLVALLCPTLQPLGILQARMLEWIAVASSRMYVCI